MALAPPSDGRAKKTAFRVESAKFGL